MESSSAWSERLQAGRQRMEEKRRRERRLKDLEAQTAKQRGIAEERQRRLEVEREDVEQLQSHSLSRVWYRLTGKLEERLGQEEREALEAQLACDTAQAALQALENELEEAKRACGETADADEAYERLLREKEDWIRKYDSDTQSRLERLQEEEAGLRTKLRETKEAIQAGDRARSKLSMAEEKLRSARNWGTYDMLGGGMIATHVKHNRIEEARSIMHEAQHALRMFEKELADLNWRSGAGDVEMGGFLSFADYFFDGFLTDWIVQGRINEALDKVTRGLGEVSGQLSRLTREEASLQSELSAKQSEHTAIIEHS